MGAKWSCLVGWPWGGERGGVGGGVMFPKVKDFNSSHTELRMHKVTLDYKI